MNPWIRRLALMLGILIPGFVMIFLQVHPVILFIALVLIAFVVLFAIGSITFADLKGQRRSTPEKPAKEPEKRAKTGVAGAEGKPGGRTSRFRGFSGVTGNLGALIKERWQAVRAGKSHIEDIDRALDRTVPSPAAGVLPALPEAPAPVGAGAGPRGPGGDPFLDLLNANFEPALLDEEIPANEERGKVVPAAKPSGKEEPGTGIPGKGVPVKEGSRETTTVKSPESKVGSGTILPVPGMTPIPPATATRPGDTMAKGSRGSPVRDGETTARSVAGELPMKGSPPLAEGIVPFTPEEHGTGKVGPAATGVEARGDGEAAAQEILSFTSEPGGTMDDLLATLKADATRVKRSDDSSLLRNLKGVRVQGKELEDDLSTLLKELK